MAGVLVPVVEAGGAALARSGVAAGLRTAFGMAASAAKALKNQVWNALGIGGGVYSALPRSGSSSGSGLPRGLSASPTKITVPGLPKVITTTPKAKPNLPVLATASAVKPANSAANSVLVYVPKTKPPGSGMTANPVILSPSTGKPNMMGAVSEPLKLTGSAIVGLTAGAALTPDQSGALRNVAIVFAVAAGALLAAQVIRR